MANLSRPFGFRPTGYLGGAKYNGTHTLYAVSASDATAMFVGDLVKVDSTLDTTALTDPYAPCIPFVKVTGGTITTGVYRGAVVGFVPEPEFSMSGRASLGLYYRLASTARYVFVCDTPTVVFEAQESGTNSYVSATNNPVNKLLDITGTAGSTTTGISGYTLTGAAGGGTTNLPFRVLRLTQRPDNFLSAASDTTPNWHWDVIMANSDLVAPNMTGI